MNPFTSDPNKRQVNLPEERLAVEPMSRANLDEAVHERIEEVNKEFSDGLEFIKNYHKTVTFFGSARFAPENHYYQKAGELAAALADHGYTIVTGGGPGIMEGANKGAYEAGGQSLGLTIELPHEQVTNPYITGRVSFAYFFNRKVCLTFSAEAFVYFPGGFGTLDELFEILTLIQTKKITKVPIILVGQDYWSPLHQFIQTVMFDKLKAIDEIDMNLYHILDDTETIVELIKQSPVRFDA